MGFLGRQVKKIGKRIKFFSRKRVKKTIYKAPEYVVENEEKASTLGGKRTNYQNEFFKEQETLHNGHHSEEYEQEFLQYLMSLSTQAFCNLISKSIRMRKEQQDVEDTFNDSSVQTGLSSIKSPTKSVKEIELLEGLESGLQNVTLSDSTLKKRTRIRSARDVLPDDDQMIDASCHSRSISVSVKRAMPLSTWVSQRDHGEASSNPLRLWRKSESPPEDFSSATAFKLLKSVFPVETLTQLEWDMGDVISKYHTSATVFFSDIVGFTGWCSTVSPCQVIDCLSAYFQILDDLAERLGVYKVETIGDAWMAVCGAPKVNIYHADCMAHFALEVLETLPDLKAIFGSQLLTMRIGLHCGPVVSGIVRADRPRWQLFGDTVNLASRMESTGVPDKIHISQAMYDLLSRAPTLFEMDSRGPVQIKGKGIQETFFLTGVNKGRTNRPESPASLLRTKEDRLSVFNPVWKSRISSLENSKNNNDSLSALRRIGTMPNRTGGMVALEDLTVLSLKSKSLTGQRPCICIMASSDNAECNARSHDDSDTSAYAKERAILVVDDVASIRMQYCRLFKKMGFKMYTAKNSEEALALMKSRTFVLVFMDINMPGISGIESTRRFREWESNTRRWKQPILAMSVGGAYQSLLADTSSRYACVFDGFVNKNSTKSIIFRHVSKYLLRWQ